jgi:hypothetical protein
MGSRMPGLRRVSLVCGRDRHSLAGTMVAELKSDGLTAILESSLRPDKDAIYSNGGFVDLGLQFPV